MGSGPGAQALAGPVYVVIDCMSGELKSGRNLDRGFTTGNAPKTFLLARTQRNDFLHPLPLSRYIPGAKTTLDEWVLPSHPAPSGCVEIRSGDSKNKRPRFALAENNLSERWRLIREPVGRRRPGAHRH